MNQDETMRKFEEAKNLCYIAIGQMTHTLTKLMQVVCDLENNHALSQIKKHSDDNKPF